MVIIVVRSYSWSANPEDGESYDHEYDDPPKILESASCPAQCLIGRRKMRKGLNLVAKDYCGIGNLI